jgi:ketosteroid isomerase-like protein
MPAFNAGQLIGMSAESAIRAYWHAFTQRDLTATVELFTADALYEMPLLGQRLAGRGEIQTGHEQAFRVLEWCAVEILSVQHTGSVAIAEARLTAKHHRDSQPALFPMAVVLESAESLIARLSIYLNTNTSRMWVDGPILGKPRI